MKQPSPYSNHNESVHRSTFNPFWIIGALIVLVPVGAGIFYLLDREEKSPAVAEIKQLSLEEEQIQVLPDDSAPKPEKPRGKSIGIATPSPSQSAPVVLPNLNDSDPEVIDALGNLSGDATLASWFNTSEIIRKTVILVDNLSQGKLAKKYLFIPGPSEKFSTYKNDSLEYINPASYARYDRYVDIIVSVNVDSAVRLYQKYSPLLDQAFAELGYPDRSFHQVLMGTLDRLLKAPVTENDLQVIRSSVLYKYAAPDLEALPAIHKQLLRIGPANTRRLQHKLSQFKAALDLQVVQ